MNTNQMEFWQGKFGSEYTDRNTFTLNELDQLYVDEYGVSRTDMNNEFIKPLHIQQALEVGCNVGNQLQALQTIGIQQLYGLELQWFAVEKAKELTKGINIIQGSAFELPFKDQYFDLVYTSGVLIHISPEHINHIIDEMYRVSNRYIWGFEYYADEYTEISYRGEQEKMWKGDFMKLFMQRYPDLRVVREKNYPYKNNSNVDQMYLLEKG